MKKILIVLSFVLLLSGVSAENYPKAYDYYVNDYASIFDRNEITYLQTLFDDVFMNTSAEVVVVTINTLNGSDIGQYAFGLGNEWGIGKSDKDNGVVILYAAEENKIFVATGYGVEGILPDSKIGRMLDTFYVPLRDNGNVSLGILVFSTQLHDILIENKAELMSDISNKRGNENVGISIGFIVAFLLLVGVISYFAGNRKNRGTGDFATFFLVDFLVRSMLLAGSRSSLSGGFRSGGGFGGSGGSFGGSFGGGSFGGGGAGR